MIALRKHLSTSKSGAERRGSGRVLLGVSGAAFLLLALLLVGRTAPQAASSANAPAKAPAAAKPDAVAAAPADRKATDIVLRVADLPERDRELIYQRNHVIDSAIATGMPMWRTFDPRDTLAETLAELSKYGVDVSDAALVNFDHIETTMPASRRAEVQALPFVYLVRDPVKMTPACEDADPNCHCPPDAMCSSYGVAAIGADLAHTAGITGAGVKVAVIDDGFRNLNNTILAGELPSIPSTNTFLINNNAGLSVVSPAPMSNDTLSVAELYGEHGTAAAEVVHEVAPGATLYLYGLKNASDGGITIGQIEKAIRSAAGEGTPTADADVILIAMSAVTTIRDPIALTAGGKNPFTDDIDYATAQGTTVVVAAGNEAFTSFEQTFAPCTDCDASATGICDEAANDTRYHTFDTSVFSDPINPITWAEEYEFSDSLNVSIENVTCYTATNAQTPSNFHVELRRYDEGTDLPSCPRDPGNALISGTDTVLGGSFSRKDLPFYTAEDDYYIYSLSVYRSGGSETPKIRVVCTAGVQYLDYPVDGDPDYVKFSISDLAVVTNAISVSGHDADGLISDLINVSSRGPSAQVGGPMKPDVAGPSEVKNFATKDWAVSFDEFFNGTSAAAAHVAGVVALMQHARLEQGLTPLTPAEVRSRIKAAAIDEGAIGEDPVYGAGLLRVPDSVLGEPPHDDLAVEFGNPGIWLYKNDSIPWQQITSTQTNELMAVGDFDGNGVKDIVADRGATGLWIFHNGVGNCPGATQGWCQISTNPATEFLAAGDIDGNGKDELVADVGSLWIYCNDGAGNCNIQGKNQAWVQLHPVSPETFVTGDIDGSGKDDIVIDFGPAFGIWTWKNNGGWVQMHTVSPVKMAVGDIDDTGKDDVVIDFGTPTGGSAVWIRLNDQSWKGITNISPKLMTTGDVDGSGRDDIIADLNPSIWIYRNNTAWVKLHDNTARSMTAGDFDGNGKDDIAFDFGNPGLWLRKNDATWVKIHNSFADQLACGNFDGL